MQAALLLTACNSWARPAFFWTTTDGTFASVDYLIMRDSDVKQSDGAIGGTRSLIGAQYAFDHESGWVASFGHEYNALDITLAGDARPQTNGDLHTLHLGSQWRKPLNVGELRLALAPALSVSSNALKNPEVLEGDSLQLWGAALYTRPIGNFAWVAGVAHDYRFGEARYYPAIGVEWRSETVQLRAVYSDVQLDWEIIGGWRLEGKIAPDGNEWRAFSRDLREADDFRREAWKAQLSLLYRFDNGIEIGCLAGVNWNQQWRYRSQGGSLAVRKSADNAYMGVRLGWRRQRGR